MKNFLVKLSLLCSSLIVAVVLSEILMALLYPQEVRNIIVMMPDSASTYDPKLGWVGKVNTTVRHQPNPDEPETFLHLNGKGLRGPEVPYERVPGKKRILVLGDSVTFGFGLDYESTYPFMLQEMLGEGYEVINAGVIGYGIDQAYLLFKREGVVYRPDIVLVGFSGGDIYDSICSVRYGVGKPFFKLENGRLKLSNVPVPRKVPASLLLKEAPAGEFLFENSHLYRLLFYRFADPNKVFDENREEMSMKNGMMVVFRIMQQMKRECNRVGCELVFLVIPRENWIMDDENIPAGQMTKTGHEAALNLARAAKVRHIDLWDPFAERITDGLFLNGDYVHTNKNGNRIIAQSVYSSGLVNQ